MTSGRDEWRPGEQVDNPKKTWERQRDEMIAVLKNPDTDLGVLRDVWDAMTDEMIRLTKEGEDLYDGVLDEVEVCEKAKTLVSLLQTKWSDEEERARKRGQK